MVWLFCPGETAGAGALERVLVVGDRHIRVRNRAGPGGTLRRNRFVVIADIVVVLRG